jgi:hypothetical protein
MKASQNFRPDRDRNMKISHARILSVFIVLVSLSTGTGISQDLDDKKAVPANDAINQARLEISSLFKKEFESATKRDEKLVFAKKMAALAAKTKDDDIGCYALYDVAINIAAIEHDVQLGLVFIAELADQYEINDAIVRSSFFRKILKSEPSPSTAEVIVGVCRQYMEAALSSDIPDVKACESYAAIATDAIKLYVKPEELVEETDRITRSLETVNAMARVQKGAGTAKDYRLAGLLFLRNPQKTKLALKYLADSDDDALKRAANLELNSPETFDESLALAASWLETSEPVAQARAAVWVQTAKEQLGDFEGLTLKKKEQEFQLVNSELARKVGDSLQRKNERKRALLAAYGGTALTEEAVVRGLEWLKRNQLKDGSWSLRGPYKGSGAQENVVAATAMALLAFQGHGSTHRNGPYKEQVVRGWNFLLKLQDNSGSFTRTGVPLHHTLYSQAQASIGICELYGMTKDAQFRALAQKAIDYAVKYQDGEGGWRYTPGQDSDISVTGWFLMMFQAGRIAGLEVPPKTLDRINDYLDRCTTNGPLYAYRPGAVSKISTTAIGLLGRLYLGWKQNDPRLNRGVQIVSANPISYENQNVYYWYYATQVMHHMGGKAWSDWNRVMRQAVPEHQIKVGEERGSWSPGDDQWGQHGGRLYTTCMSIYMLEVYYRNTSVSTLDVK